MNSSNCNNAEVWQLPKSIYNKAVKELGADIDFDATYLKTVFIHEDGHEPVIFDLERLSQVSGTVAKICLSNHTTEWMFTKTKSTVKLRGGSQCNCGTTKIYESSNQNRCCN